MIGRAHSGTQGASSAEAARRFEGATAQAQAANDAPPNAAWRTSVWSSPVWKAVAGAALGMAIIGTGLGYYIGTATNEALTHRTRAMIESDLRTAEAIFRSGGLPALVAHVGRPSEQRRFKLLDRSAATVAGGLPLSAPEFDSLAKGALVKQHVGRVLPLPDGLSLAVAQDISDQIAVIERLRRAVLASLAALAAIAAGAALFAHRASMRRLTAISEATEKILAGNLSVRLPVDPSIDSEADAFDALVRNVNAMLTRIEDLMVTVRDVSDNIAHDLRTPLNRLRNNAEEALRVPGASPGHARALELVIDEADEIIRTFNALLEIARLDGGGLAQSFEPFDASKTAQDLIEFYEPVLEDEGFTTAIDIEPELTLVGNRHLFGQVLSNLIDNAIKYGRSDSGTSHLAFTVKALGPDICITVADRGIGIRPEDRVKAMHRFGRIDASRSQPGTGLGLNLVSAIVRVHKGAMSLEDNAPGLRVRIALPHGQSAGPEPSPSVRDLDKEPTNR